MTTNYAEMTCTCNVCDEDCKAAWKKGTCALDPNPTEDAGADVEEVPDS